ncbi:hypothetical protein NIES4071_23380 [Calothrix sp. NIES-4071]|nr:hypothetical protein NIES4071_23380 [Calothrix sp. NIES-4071]BAZ56663.1 hypothetical protein NIES4105_23330 [Calothrix sp. NIES-4105]
MNIILDSGPLGLITNKNAKNREIAECKIWANSLISKDCNIYIPAISYYEVRRELIRTMKLDGVRRLDNLKYVKGFEYIEMTQEIIVKASELWAWARNTGQQTAHDDAVDGDVILAATAIIKAQQEGKTIIATTNVRHIQRYYTDTKNWKEKDWTVNL